MMRSHGFLSYAALVSVLCGASTSLSAQGVPAPPPPPPSQMAELKMHLAESTAMMIANPAADMERIVKGAPFSAQATTTTTQVLGDGNKIVQTTEMALARDGEGRTRREMSVDKLGPWTTDTTGKMVFLRDPVALTTYVLTPDGQHALKGTMRGPAAGAERGAAERRETKLRQAGEVHARVEAFGGEVRTFTTNGQMTNVIVGDLHEGAEQKESLGEQTIEGVRAQGTRVTRTIAAGQIGNEREIQIVSETWYSPDLQMIVQSKRSDPRVGETVYRLANVQLAEPDASLFQVPAGYTVQDEKKHFEFELQERREFPDGKEIPD
jgi:hypothetical protein